MWTTCPRLLPKKARPGVEPATVNWVASPALTITPAGHTTISRSPQNRWVVFFSSHSTQYRSFRQPSPTCRTAFPAQHLLPSGVLSCWPVWPGTHSRILFGIQRAAQTVLGVYLKRTCSRVPSSALGVHNDYALYRSTHSPSPSQSVGSVYGRKLNQTQQKHAFTDQKKCATTQDKHKKTKAMFSRPLRHPAWKLSGFILRG